MLKGFTTTARNEAQQSVAALGGLTTIPDRIHNCPTPHPQTLLLFMTGRDWNAAKTNKITKITPIMFKKYRKTKMLGSCSWNLYTVFVWMYISCYWSVDHCCLAYLVTGRRNDSHLTSWHVSDRWRIDSRFSTHITPRSPFLQPPMPICAAGMDFDSTCCDLCEGHINSPTVSLHVSLQIGETQKSVNQFWKDCVFFFAGLWSYIEESALKPMRV